MTIQTKTKLNNLLAIFVICCAACLVCIPFGIIKNHFGYDLMYHFTQIQSLNQAWKEGNVGRIYPLIGQDYAYAPALFYSMLPSLFAVMLINVFHLPVFWAISVEFLIVFVLAGLIVFWFVSKLCHSTFVAAICACFYICFPYFLYNIYARFAFSETFMVLVTPLVAFGCYELINGNHKLSIPLLSFGFSLGIICHLSLTFYLAIFAAIYICINFKKFKSNLNWLSFLISCCLILLMSFAFYLPMIYNYGEINLLSMGRNGLNLYGSEISLFEFQPLLFSTLISIVIYIIYSCVYFHKPKEERVKQKQLYIMSTCVAVALSPLFPWYILNFPPFTMIQFANRLLMFNALMVALMFMGIITSLDLKRIKNCFLAGSVAVFLAAFCFQIIVPATSKGYHVDDNSFGINTNISYNEGLGGTKSGDYVPKGTGTEYLFSRLNTNYILETNAEISEIANYQQLNAFKFLVGETADSYVVLNIPYDLCGAEEVKINQILLGDNYQIKPIEKQAQIINQQAYLKLEFLPNGYQSIISIEYPKQSELGQYFVTNPQEFKVKSGRATFADFKKTSSSDYSVKVDADDAVVELPNFYYKGYKILFYSSDGVKTLTPEHNENGFVQINISGSGVLDVKFEANYITTANIISLIGLILFVLCSLFLIVTPKEKLNNMINKIKEYFNKHKTLAEIIRFLIVGGIATLVDMFAMGVTMYLFERGIYNSFINVFINTPTPSTAATIVGTTVGFIAGLVVNYVLSILFVFNEKGNSKTAQGFIIFTVLSAIGLGINILGMYIGFDLLHFNQWAVKIVMIIVVLIYNYISKRLILFKNKSNNKQEK